MKHAMGMLAALALLLGGVEQARADFINNSTGLTNPTETVTFSEVTLIDGTPLTNQFAAYGVTFSGLYYDTSYLLPNIDGSDAINFLQGTSTGVNNPFSINFSAPQTSAAFALATNDGEMTTITAKLNGVVVETHTVITYVYNQTDFYGFIETGGVTFNEIDLSVSGAIVPQAVVDNIQLGPAVSSTPEPSSLALLGLGGVTLAGRFWRRRKQDLQA